MQDSLAHAPILVLGIPRSGTSLLSGILAACGAWTGTTVTGGGSENPKGFFENTFLREGINKPLLKNLNCDPLGVRKLPELDQVPIIAPLRDAILTSVEQQGYDGKSTWLFKDAKLVLLWPAWKAAFPAARWVIVDRDREQIINSCLRTSFMKQHSGDPAFWNHWIDEYLERMQALESTDLWCRHIATEPLIRGDLGEARELAEALGLSWNENAVAEFIEPEYWHGKDNRNTDRNRHE